MHSAAGLQTKRLFHFVNENYGLENIKLRRLKVSRLDDLNDPFELLAFDVSDKWLRGDLTNFKRAMAAQYGVLCFSQRWQNPVMWGHYADRHRGLCLGFDVAADLAAPVSYTHRRLRALTMKILEGRLDQEITRQLLFTKFAHWRYETEERSFVRLTEAKRAPETELYFVEFSAQLKLVTVIAGAESTINRSRLREALGPLAESVEMFKARPAFRNFRIVRNKDESRWK